MLVNEIMTTQVVTCTPWDTARTAAKLMKDHCIGALPVVWDKADPLVEGIITDRDLCCGIAGDARDSNAVLVSELMTRVPVTCEPDFTIEECLRLIEENQVRRIPVVNERGRCVGIVTQVDIARKVPPDQVAEMVSEIAKPMSKERESFLRKRSFLWQRDFQTHGRGTGQRIARGLFLLWTNARGGRSFAAEAASRGEEGALVSPSSSGISLGRLTKR